MQGQGRTEGDHGGCDILYTAILDIQSANLRFTINYKINL